MWRFRAARCGILKVDGGGHGRAIAGTTWREVTMGMNVGKMKTKRLLWKVAACLLFHSSFCGNTRIQRAGSFVIVQELISIFGDLHLILILASLFLLISLSSATQKCPK